MSTSKNGQNGWILAIVIMLLLGVGAGCSVGAGRSSLGENEFSNFSKLVGDWEGVKIDEAGTEPASVRYRMTSGGSAIVETLFPGTPHEMVSVYHQDGKNLVMTHYCALGNQVTMKLNEKPLPDSYAFEYSGATNMVSKNDPHMHRMRVTMVSDDQLKEEWTLYEKGKPVHAVTFELTRKK